jgi:2-C-methyl-D-erythritol 4-phosphate cytidylyltransferase/2-C-methyl-D-erythritol 2,4-cyclodiphosphate synthase
VPGPILKQLRHLGGRVLIAYSLDALSDAGCEPIVVVVPSGSEEDFAPLSGWVGVRVVTGGVTRQQSVARGLEVVTTERVVVHDAVRPFVTAVDVRRAAAALEQADGAVTAVPVDETLKRVEDGQIIETVDRSGLWRAQTPQAFRVDVLRAAHERAAAGSVAAGDDSVLVERYGGKVVVVRGSRRNLKLTFPEDFALAEAMMRG